MRCPFCGSDDNRVIDSRVARDGLAIRRRRACGSCAQRFTTYEEIETMVAEVAKRDGRSEPFSRDKLLRSLRLACQKRPVHLEQLTDFAARLEARVSVMPRRTISSEKLGELVLAFLRDHDPVAYVRYASVYRSFNSVDEFMRELEALRSESEPAEPGDPEG